MRVVGQSRRVLEQFAIASAHLAENAHGGMRVLMVMRQRLEMLPQCCHYVLRVGSHDRIEELLSKIVDAELESAKTLADELGRRLKSEYQRLHEVAEIWQQDAESNGYSKTQIDKDFAPAWLCRIEKRIEVFQQHREQRQHVLVQKLESTTADTAEESSQQQKVVCRLICLAREFHRLHDKVTKMRLKDDLVLFREDGDGHKGHLEQAQTD